MIIYLLIAIAIIFTLLLVLSAYCGDFPFLEYNNPALQAVCRSIFVLCNVALIVIAFIAPKGLLADNVAINILLLGVSELLYYLANIIGIVILDCLWHLIKRLLGWALFGDKDHFFDYYD